MGMILRIASSRIVGQGDIVGRSGYFSLNLSANSVMRGRLDARRTLKSLVADLRLMKTIAYDNSKRIVNVRYYLYGSNGKIEKMYSKGTRGSREETYFYENDRLQKIVIRQFDRNDIEQDTLQHSFDYKPNGELKFIILSTELYSETIYQET